jgi:hypothetical protein
VLNPAPGTTTGIKKNSGTGLGCLFDTFGHVLGISFIYEEEPETGVQRVSVGIEPFQDHTHSFF